MRLRLPIVHLMIAAIISCALVGCSAMTPGRVDAVQPVTDAPRAGNAYLLRGFIGVFSTGIDRLGTEVNAAGTHGEVFQDDQWSALADQIAVRFHGHPDAEPLVLIGHSYGADDVVRIARKLDAANVPVNLLITLDPVTAPAVPKNVRLCVNLYQSNGVWDKLPWLRGIPLVQDTGSKGTLYNANIRTDRTDLLEPGLDHFNIEKKQKVHEEVLRLLLAVCPTRQDWIASQSAPLPAVATATKMPRVVSAKPTRLAASPFATASIMHESSN
jgi:thioesterase domain-containing protein